MTDNIALNQIFKNPLPVQFYDRPVQQVAKDLLGKIFIRKSGKQYIVARIVETEAYHQFGDKSSHAYRGKTLRNSVMFGPPSHLYVYFTYGMHFCMNVVCENEGTAAAVLLRAAEPLSGFDFFRINRPKAVKDFDLMNGPAKFCQAIKVAREQNGISLITSEFRIADNGGKTPEYSVSGRIGISEDKDLPWRFFITGNKFVSKYKIH